MKLKITTLLTTLMLANAASAATAIDLQHQPAAYLKKQLAAPKTSLKPTRTYLDFNQTAHVRIQQAYLGVPVWNATGVVHTPHAKAEQSLANTTANTTMNGIIYEGLEKDLSSTPAFALTEAQKNKALQIAKANFSKSSGLPATLFTENSVKQIIFIDDMSQAHYGWLVSFYADDKTSGAHRPTFIVDAVSLKIHRTWDRVMTIKDGEAYPIVAGGIGGNEKSGDVIYDGAPDHATALNILAEDIVYRSEKMTICALMTDDILVSDVAYAGQPAYTRCVTTPQKHNGIAWMSLDNNETRWKNDMVNGAFSPSLDAFAAATLIKNFYNDWYGVPPLVLEDGKTPMQMVMRVHYGRNYENAFWNGEVMTFGDGGKTLYPLTSLGVSAHEISHGFTSQHGQLANEYPQMAALHEAFSDMAAVSLEYYHSNKIIWDIGREIKKGEGAFRYLDEPTRDGHSIDNLKDFDNTEEHAGAGIFNKAFYLIATTNGWDIKKAFNIMVKANMNYWTSSMKTMPEAACGVLAATRDYNYNLGDVRVAFVKVGINTDMCDVR